MKEYNIYTTLGLKALQRASAKVAEFARKHNFRIPIWEDGRVKYVKPEMNTEHRDGEDEIPLH